MTPAEEVKAMFRQYMQSYPAVERVRRYERGAKVRMQELQLPDWIELPVDDRNRATTTLTSEAVALYDMLMYSQHCYEAVNKQDIDAFAQAFERLVNARIHVALMNLERHEQSRKGKKKKGTEGLLKQTVRHIMDGTGVDNIDSFLVLIKAQDHDIFYSVNNPLPIRFENDWLAQKVWDSNQVAYTIVKTRKEKKVGFKRVDNIIREIKKT